MRSDTPTRDTPSRCRPRNAESTEAILQAAAELLDELGHAGEDDSALDARADLGPALLLYRAQVLRQLDDPDAAGDEAAALMLRQPA